MSAGVGASAIVSGLRLDGYELLCPIGEGGMASVWIARLLRKHGFEKLVAIKMILPKYAQDPTFQHMFLDEARLASRIDHVNVAHIHDLGEKNGLLYLVMELIDGDALTRLRKMIAAKGDTFPTSVALRIMADVCAGLHAAHELADLEGTPLGVVHRDVSPQNILVSVEGVSKLIDFGVAKAVNRLVENTNTGYVKGKVQYMAPEQALARGVDRRADVWACGAVLFHLLAGRPPFEADNSLAMLHLLESGAAPTNELPPGVPGSVTALIFRALAHDPAARFQSADEMRDAIEQTRLAGSANEVAACLRTYLGEAAAHRRDLLKSSLRGAEARRGSNPDLVAPEPAGHEAPDTTIRVIPRTPVMTQPIAQPNPRVAARTVAMSNAPLAPLEAPDLASRSGIAGPYMPAPLETPDLASRSGLAPVAVGRISSPGFPPVATLPVATPPPRPSFPAGVGVALGVLVLIGAGASFAVLLRGREPGKAIAVAAPSSAPSVPLPPASSSSAPFVAESDAPPPAVDAGPIAAPRIAPRPSASLVGAPDRAASVERARAAAETGDHATVRRLLESRVRGGQASTEEATLVLDACKAQRDGACAEEVRRKYPLSGRE